MDGSLTDASSATGFSGTSSSDTKSISTRGSFERNETAAETLLDRWDNARFQEVEKERISRARENETQGLGSKPSGMRRWVSFSRGVHSTRSGHHQQRGTGEAKSRSADSEYSVRTLMPNLPKHGVHTYTDNMDCIEEEKNTPRGLSFRTLHSGYKLIGTALSTLRRNGKVADASPIHKTDSDDNLIISQLSQRESALKRHNEEKWRLKSTSNTIYTLAPFIPRLLQDTLNELDPMFPDTIRSEREAYNAVASAMRPSMATFCGAVMVADVTGFTMLTEKLSKRGTNGVEILTKCINNFFSKVIEVVFEYQGDVIKFAGDSLIVAFYPSDKELSVSSNEGLTEATIRSVKCACRLSKTLGHVLMVPNGDVIPISQAETKGWAKQKLFFNAARAFKMAGNRREANLKEEKQRHHFHPRKSAVQTLKSMMTPSERTKASEDTFEHFDLRGNIEKSLSRMRKSTSFTNSKKPAPSTPLLQRNETGVLRRSLEFPPNKGQSIARQSLDSNPRSTSWERGASDTGGNSRVSRETNPRGVEGVARAAKSISGGERLQELRKSSGPNSYHRGRPLIDSSSKSTTSQVQYLDSWKSPKKHDSVVNRKFRELAKWISSKNQRQIRSPSKTLMRSKSLFPRANSQPDDLSSGKVAEGNGSSHVSGTEKSSTSDSLSLKVLVGSGTVCIFRVGGHEEQSRDRVSGIKRWEFFIGDEPHSEPGPDGTMQPLRQIAEIEHHAEAGDVIVSKEVVQAAGQHFRYEPLGDGASRIPLNEGTDTEGFRHIALHDHTFHFLPPRARLQCAAIMRMHVLDNVRQRIEAGHVDFVNEIRRLSVLFMGFPCLSKSSDADGLESVQIAVKNVQQRMLEFDGSFLQFRCDEKGFLAICAFGLPGKSHVDNCSRAVTSALKIAQSMDEVGYRVVVGVTTGDLLCACVGSRTRAEYTVFGDAINLSARLMCKGKTGLGDILCDHATYERAKRKAHFAPLEPLTVKGKEGSVIVYRVLPLKVKQNRRSRALSSTARSRLHQPMIGRYECVQTISETISAVLEDGTGRAVVIEGEPGSGKTKLVHELQRMKAGDRNETQQYYGMGDAAFKSLPLFPWRRIFEDMFTHDRMASTSLQTAPRSDFVSLEEDMQPTSLGHLLKAYIEDYEEEWRSLIANSLDLSPSLIPLAVSTAQDRQVDRSLVPRMYHLVSLAEFILVLQNPLSRSRSKDIWKRRSANLRRAFSDPVHLGQLLSPQRFHSIDERVFSTSTWSNDPISLRLQSGRKVSTYEANTSMEEEAPMKAKMEVTKELRSQQLLEILVDVCRIFIQLYGPIIIFLEDIHHFDSMSWTLLNRLVEDSKVGCVVIATLRPNDGTLAPHTRNIQGKEMVHQKANDAFKQLKQAPNTIDIKLTGLDLEATRRLIALTAEDENVSEEIVAAVWEKTEGLPMYIEQMSIYLRENSMLHMRSQAGSAINSDAGLADFIRTTVTIHHALIKQMDQLKPSTHLTLKVAAVLGANITIKKLRVLYPYSISPRSLDKSLVELEDAGFLKPSQEVVPENRMWQFNSHMARDAIYELIPHFQRRALHAKLAALLNTVEYKAPNAIIAYHWTQSCAGVEATEWRLAMCAMEEWEKATHEAIEKSAPAEALRLLQKAVDISNKIMSFYTQPEGDPGSMSMIVNSASSGQMSFESQSSSSFTMHSPHPADFRGSSGVPSISAWRQAHWETTLARLYLKSINVESTSHKESANQENAWKHLCTAIHALGLPVVERRDFVPQVAECCAPFASCGFGRKAWKGAPRRQHASWEGMVRHNLGLAAFDDKNRLLTPDEILEAKQVIQIMLEMPHVHGVKKQCIALLQYFNSCRHPLEADFLDLEQRSQLVWQVSRASISSSRSYGWTGQWFE